MMDSPIGVEGEGAVVGVGGTLVVGVAAVLVGVGAPDGACNRKDGLLVRGVEGEAGPSDVEVLDALVVLALEEADFLDG